MNTRKSCLPPGWYPQTPAKIGEFLADFGNNPAKSASERRIFAAVAPHAGWYYSGAVAAEAVSALAGDSKDCETVVVIGGHLPKGTPALFAMEDAVSAPLGLMEIDKSFREALIGNISGSRGLKTAEDRYRDNTVEVLLPMVNHFFPGAKLLWIRLPADIQSFEAGKTIAKTAASLGRKIVVLGSTDLTHYGPNYGWSPKGSGKDALGWVKNVNDKRFIDAVEAGDTVNVLHRGETERSSCSAGAVLGVMGYSAARRSEKAAGQNNKTAMDDNTPSGNLLSYTTSADVSMAEGEGLPDSFVGYGAFVFTE